MSDTLITVANSLATERNKYGSIYPKKETVQNLIDQTLSLLFPHFAGNTQLDSLITTLRESFSSNGKISEDSVSQYLLLLPTLQTKLTSDAEAILQGDPAAKNVDEVIIAYPGFFAIAVHRIAHFVHAQGFTILSRLLSEHAHSKTGIDIHPAAKIGARFVIDHGTGIVIGETAEIHENVKMYQGVTLGGLSVDKKLADIKRHPTIESDVVIYANATILGGETVVGAGSIIGGSVWLIQSVPKNSMVYHKAEVMVRPRELGQS